MGKTRIKELEATLLDQIEKLNDDSIFEDADKAKILIERSKAISDLTQSFVEVNRMKLDVVKELNKGGNLYENYLGVESDNPVGKA
jgi:hypothetical protein